jgi:hypothetical protein
MRLMKTLAALLALVAVTAAGCGGSKNASPPTTTTTPATTSTGSASPSPLQAEAKAAATGDVPDNQVFLRFENPSAGYSMKYPEGWAKQGSGSTVTIRDKNNVVRIVVKPGGAVTPADAKHDLAAVTGATIAGGPAAVTISGRPAVKVSYTTRSAANSVTGKRLTLVVDRYYLRHGGKLAVVDLGTPRGVDNVDAYRLMIESFTWK